VHVPALDVGESGEEGVRQEHMSLDDAQLAASTADERVKISQLEHVEYGKA
jgi:hypothetical protein